jgi:1-acyl-sn-glycerol-3-phosphate acyltransferase
MWSQGKINEFSVGRPRSKGQWGWFAYFALTLTVIGLFLAYGLVAPLYLVGFIFPRVNKIADWIMVRGIGLLMDVQPWFNAELKFRKIEEGGCLIVSNHRSHLDAFILLSNIQGIKILAKESLFSIPGIGFIMWVSGQIPLPSKGIDSFLTAMNTVQKRLKRGETVHIFPEMTRCTPGHVGTLDFSLAPFRIAHQDGFPIIPIVFKGTDSVWPKGRTGLDYGLPVSAVMLETIDSRKFKTVSELRDLVRSQIEESL